MNDFLIIASIIIVNLLYVYWGCVGTSTPTQTRLWLAGYAVIWVIAAAILKKYDVPAMKYFLTIFN